VDKPSVYLQGKCECLEKVLDFFLSNNGGYCRTVKDKRTVFLSQIDFWDWEMDELCFSIDSFTERSKAWDSMQTVRECVAKLGLPVKAQILYEIESNRGWDGWRINSKVVAPVDILNKVIQKWNKLLKVCEETLLMDTKEYLALANMGCQFVKNLDKYRKKEITDGQQ